MPIVSKPIDSFIKTDEMKDVVFKTMLCALTTLIMIAPSLAQATITGIATDNNGEPVIYGNVDLYKDGDLYKSTYSDFDGYYTISDIELGIYDLELTYPGFPSKKLYNIKIKRKKPTTVNLRLEAYHSCYGGQSEPVNFTCCNYDFWDGKIVQSEDISRMAF